MEDLAKYLLSKNELEIEFTKKIIESQKIFEEILCVCNNDFLKGTGSYLFDGQNYAYCASMFDKQLLLYQISKNVNSVLEIGTYMGHSLLIMLLANPDIKITCIDIDKRYTKPSVELLVKKLNADITYIEGDSLNIIPTIKETFDLFHIDGTHTLDCVKREFELCKKISKPEIMKVIFDDYNNIEEIKNTILEEHTILEQITPNCAWHNSYIKIKL
jgi:spermidine synthase